MLAPAPIFTPMTMATQKPPQSMGGPQHPTNLQDTMPSALSFATSYEVEIEMSGTESEAQPTNALAIPLTVILAATPQRSSQASEHSSSELEP